ncbi:MAG: hypothetical protein GX589_07175, partial [Deltaproteobacteria bacterium]|nr:hypothetical protein [Deltaproteobacteria bacterium]
NKFFLNQTGSLRRRTASALIALGLVALVGTAEAQRAVPGDYDGDAKTDVLVTRAIGDFKFWFARFSNETFNVPLLFGLASDTEAAGDFHGDGKVRPAVTRAINGFMTWYILTPAGQVEERLFGLENDLLLAAYMDQDDIADQVAIRSLAGGLNWFASLSASSTVGHFQWGLDGDTAYVADTNGNGVDDAIVVRNVGGFKNWFVRTDSGVGSAGILFGLDSDAALQPADLDGDGIADFIVRRETAGFSYFFVRLNNADGTEKGIESLQFGLTTDAVIVGNNFNADLANFTAFRRGASVTDQAYSFVRLPGISDPNMIAVPFGLSGDTLISPQGLPLAPEEDDSGSGSLGAVCSRTTSPFSGFLWKPASTDSGGSREGKPMVAWKSGPPTSNSCLQVYAQNGTVVSQFGMYASGGKYGARWYSGWGCGDGKSASQIAQAAQAAAGSNNVYLQGSGGACVGPINPTSRNGSL